MSNKRIVLGSGTLYCVEHTEDVEPSVETLKNASNELAKIQGGATFEYTPSTYTAKSDDGLVSKTVITEEVAKLNCGICTIDGTVLEKIISTASATRDEENKKTVVKIGGISNDNGKSYDFLFYHTDAKDGDIAVLLTGKNTGGLSLGFTKDKETVTNLTLEAEPMSDGSLGQVEFYDAK